MEGMKSGFFPRSRLLTSRPRQRCRSTIEQQPWEDVPAWNAEQAGLSLAMDAPPSAGNFPTIAY